MTTIISKFITKTLLDHQGSLDFQDLEEQISQSFTVADQMLRSVLFDDGKISIKEGIKNSRKGQILRPDSVIVAKTSVRICQKKTGGCQDCDGLHLCRYFVCGNCMFGNKCKNSHTLNTPNNNEVLERFGLQDLTEKQLFQLLLQNDPYLLPEICTHYNTGNDVHGSCRFAASCTKLHMCLHYFQGDCKFGAGCKRSHNLDPHAMRLFKGFSQENIENLHTIFRNKLIITGHQSRPKTAVAFTPPRVKSPTPQPPSHQPSSSNPRLPTASATIPTKPISDAERNEICLFFIRRHCTFKDKCARVHWHLPYRWQVLEADGATWKDASCMESIEKAYCNPAQDTSCMDQPTPSSGFFSFLQIQRSPSTVEPSVDFMTMTFKGIPVRRLSTASSVSKPPHFILTTEWVWYWKDDAGKWQEFGKSDGDTQAALTSQTLENVYHADIDTEIPFSAGNQQYILYLKDPAGTQQMYQQNVKFKTKREVRRRPRFVSSQDVELQLQSQTPQSSSTAENVPSSWDKNALPEFGYKLVPLSSSAKERQMIETLFKRTMPQSKFNSIHRIQNPSLWKVFHWQKEQMKERNGGQLVTEKYLFHGTDPALVEAICEQNFDWRVCGVHGTVYGKGSYFARDASYSDRYAKASGGTKVMFVALVLVGEYTKGQSSYVRPPPKGSGRSLYDSCVDNTANPSIYVIFDKQQIYPEYVINYT